MVAYFSRDCPAGPLNLCRAIYAEPETDTLDFLSYEFDPNKKGIGIAAAALSRLEGRLADLDEDETLDDLSFAVAIWQVLLNFKNGFRAVENVDALLAPYADLAGLSIDRRRSEVLSQLHRQLFEADGTVVRDLIQRLVRSGRERTRRN